MHLVGRNHLVTDRSLIDTIRSFHEIGYTGMELSMLRGTSPYPAFDYMDDYVIDKVNSVCSDLNFKIEVCSCHANYAINDVVFAAQKKLLRTAKKYGTDVVIMSTFIPFEEREGHPEVYERLTTRTRELCNIAEEEGVSIAIEVEPNQLVHNLKRFFALADAVKSPALKINFDVGHLYLSEGDVYKAMEETKGLVVFSHLDNMVMGEHCHKLPWEGDLDLRDIYKVMKEKYYDGPVALDIYLQNYMESAPACLEYVNKNVF